MEPKVKTCYPEQVRPLIHPSIDDVTLEGILHALADPVRAAIYAQLAASDGAATCSTFVNVIDREIPKSTLSQHFRALREAGLVRSERNGVEMRRYTGIQLGDAPGVAVADCSMAELERVRASVPALPHRRL